MTNKWPQAIWNAMDGVPDSHKCSTYNINKGKPRYLALKCENFTNYTDRLMESSKNADKTAAIKWQSRLSRWSVGILYYSSNCSTCIVTYSQAQLNNTCSPHSHPFVFSIRFGSLPFKAHYC